jgi:phosphoribosyl 1,2-cyclic phosphodiesterase
MTRVSFAEFISIEKQFKVQHFNRCQQIVLLFRKSYSYSTDAEKFENNTNELIVKLKYLAENAG